MKKPNFGNEIINYKNHYLMLFEETILFNIQAGKSPEDIVNFTLEVNAGIISVNSALIAGFRKYTTVEDRQKVLLKIEKENK